MRRSGRPYQNLMKAAGALRAEKTAQETQEELARVESDLLTVGFERLSRNGESISAVFCFVADALEKLPLTRRRSLERAAPSELG